MGENEWMECFVVVTGKLVKKMGKSIKADKWMDGSDGQQCTKKRPI
jgi:hypothetical protein